MEFSESIPVTFKEITPNYNIPEKWKEVILNTGGTHSTLQDIKLPQKAGGYWYKDSKKVNTRNRFLYWQTTSDAIEISESSLDTNLTGSNLRCKVAPGTPPLSNIMAYERLSTREVVILAATVSSVHRLIFPHPESFDKKSTFGSMSTSSPSIFHDTSSVNSPNNYFILNQYSNATTGVAHTCSSLLRDNGEAVFALAFGHSGEGGVLLVKLPISGNAVTMVLKRESTVPRFLSGITGALRGKTDGVETYGVVLTYNLVVAICGDACLRAWALDDGGAPVAVSPPISQNLVRPKPPPHGHMLQKTTGLDGSVILVAYLSFPNECEFVVIKMHDAGASAVRFSHICRLFGPQLDLLDYTIGYGEGNNVIWALWSQPDGETVITSSCLGVEASWRAVGRGEALPPLPALASARLYRDHLMAPGLFPPAVLSKALRIYRRTWGNNETSVESDLGEAALSAVQARVRQLAARQAAPDHKHLMHKCWSDLYSWCVQYMEGLQKPLGLMVSQHSMEESEAGWWCAVVRRAGVSLVRELEPLERMMSERDGDSLDKASSLCALSGHAMRVVSAGAQWERAATRAGAAELERRLFACCAVQHRLLPRMLHLLLSADVDDTNSTILTPQQVDELTATLEPIKDLQSAVLELNDALRLDVPEIDAKDGDEEYSDYDNLFASDLGVSIVTESIRQMAEMRSRVARGALAALGAARGAGGAPGAGHCAVHWQAYRALLYLRGAALSPAPHALSSNSLEAFRLKLSVLGAEPSAAVTSRGPLEGAVAAYVRGAGGRRARRHLAAAGAPLHWHQALPLFTYHLAHQLWAVSGGFEFGWWLATINQPRLVQSYVTMLEPWCEWNACSRQFILGLALLDLEDVEGAYTAFCKAAKGVSTEPFLRQLVAAPDAHLTQHQALVLYYMKVIKLFEIHDAGACVVRLAETAISIADKDDPNLAMFQWLVFKWHLSGGRVQRALSAAAANPAPAARAAAAAQLLSTLASRKQLSALVSCGALAADAERAAAQRAKLADAHEHNPYYDFLFALHVSRHHYRKAAAVMYERAARCLAERGAESDADAESGPARGARRRYLAAAVCCLRLARPDHAFLARPDPTDRANSTLQVIGPEELAAELREEDPDSLDPVQKALLKNESIDFDKLYPRLKDADPETLLAVTKRIISTGQFMPSWFLQRYMEVDGAGCVRALAAGGRCAEAAAACCAALRRALVALQPRAAPAYAPLALADLLLCELQHHRHTPTHRQVYEELNLLVKEYTEAVVRTSEDMKNL
ncbi:nuclear pore complex protein Nup160 homolog isoform X2 [Plodia interpunctella]|uniref:nuclear pore complex protein Nup160 homolog isoform X2 n=1 Tax=Plodia interpunctella TaxID=58824 RepID=UPI0023681D82|nr:nuclear pore complex protein Nup160 homolog isoform X2 [Plodia interpunctella]